MDHHTRTEKYRPWKKVPCHRIHSRRRQPCHERTGKPHLNCSTDSGTFIHSGQGIGYPPKTFIDSDSDDNVSPHIPDLEDYCRTCLSRKVRCTCKPMSDWSVELIDITQPDCPNPDNNANNNDRNDRQDQVLPSDWSDQDNFWMGKTYDKVRPITLKPVPVPPLGERMRRAIGVSTFTHITTELRLHHKFLLPNLPQIGPKASGQTQRLKQ